MIAVQAAGLHRDTGAIAPLIELLKTDHLPLRRKGAEVLGRIAKPEAIPALQFPRSNVEELAPSAVSLMPDGLEKSLTRQQLADLLEFLCQQR
jgi:HEAT repeat protein